MNTFCSRNLVNNVENVHLLHYFAFDGGLLNFLLTTWTHGIKNSTNAEIFQNEIILDDVSFVINSIIKNINSR